jgi:regulator of sigma E protease
LDYQLIFAAAENTYIQNLSGWLTFWYHVGLVLLGLNLVILVHELGHFLVARWFGVKCEKFYIWFDIFGWRFFRIRRGETEYGLGVLPLGGYVKMLGQEDNPVRLREEIQRAKLHLPAEEISRDPELVAAQKALYDPRSYLAQSVPRRMAIISAGVAMNVLFAFVAALIAYRLGVEQQSCSVGMVFPGEAAWRAGIRPGDVIEEINGRPTRRFTDLQRAISVGDISDGIELSVRRITLTGEEHRLRLRVAPDRIRVAPTIGVTNGFSTRLHPEIAFTRQSPAAYASPQLRPGDEVVAVEGYPIHSYGQIHTLFGRWPDRPLHLRVRRHWDQPGSQPAEIDVLLPPRKVRHLGLVLRLGPIVAVQEGSPAAQAGIQPGDLLDKIDDGPIGDPLKLADYLRLLSQTKQTVEVTFLRGEQREPVRVTLPLKEPDWFDSPLVPGSPSTIPIWGIAYRVVPEVVEILPGTPVAGKEVRSGSRIVEVAFRMPETGGLGTDGARTARQPTPPSIKLEDEAADWTLVHWILQDLPPGTKVELRFAHQQTILVEPIEAEDWYFADRGLVFAPASFVLQANGLVEAIRLGAEETWSSLTLIVRTLQKLGTGQVSPRGLAGPVGIAQIAYHYASEGLATFLIFLCLLSANLAVLNFIPIPVLDGGHMLFLAYEGIRGKPPSESVVTGLTFAGLIFLLALMIWVTGMDVMRIFGG